MADEGDVGQNNRINNTVVYLKQRHFIPQPELDQILAEVPPMLRVDIMEEIEPGSAVFCKKTFDLVHTAIECGAKSAIERLLPYIDFSLYDREEVTRLLSAEL